MPGTARSIDELIRLEAGGAQLKYLLFWGHRPRPDGRPGTSCLSQWWPASFTVDGSRYRSAEHYMMAAKARTFGDQQTEKKILTARSPGAAKALGRQVRGFDEKIWAARRWEIVVRASVEKFGQNPRLRDYLQETGGDPGLVLVEASPHDRIWGIGLAESDPRALTPARWEGLNLLGFALMEARSIVSQ